LIIEEQIRSNSAALMHSAEDLEPLRVHSIFIAHFIRWQFRTFSFRILYVRAYGNHFKPVKAVNKGSGTKTVSYRIFWDSNLRLWRIRLLVGLLVSWLRFIYSHFVGYLNKITYLRSTSKQ